MPSTRRQFVLWGITLLTGVSGCTSVLDKDTVQEVNLDLTNRTDEFQTFHFALEGDDGLGQWHDFTLEPDSNHQAIIEPSSDRQWTEYHAIAGDKQVSGTLLGQGDERTCLQLNYVIEEDQIVALLPSSQPLC